MSSGKLRSDKHAELRIEAGLTSVRVAYALVQNHPLLHKYSLCIYVYYFVELGHKTIMQTQYV